MNDLPCCNVWQGFWTVFTMALKGKIRALHQRECKSISEIARRTSLSRNTIKKWLKAPAEAAPKYRRQSLPGKLAPFVATLTQALKADAHPPRAPRRLSWAVSDDYRKRCGRALI